MSTIAIFMILQLAMKSVNKLKCCNSTRALIRAIETKNTTIKIHNQTNLSYVFVPRFRITIFVTESPQISRFRNDFRYGKSPDLKIPYYDFRYGKSPDVKMKGAGWVQRENYCQGTFRNENRYGILTSGDFP